MEDVRRATAVCGGDLAALWRPVRLHQNCLGRLRGAGHLRRQVGCGRRQIRGVGRDGWGMGGQVGLPCARPASAAAGLPLARPAGGKTAAGTQSAEALLFSVASATHATILGLDGHEPHLALSPQQMPHLYFSVLAPPIAHRDRQKANAVYVKMRHQPTAREGCLFFGDMDP